MANFDGYNIQFGGGQINITPNRRNRRGAMPFSFGLGNALIRLNLNKLPDGLTVPITGDSTADGLLPNIPFKLKRWYALPENVSMKDRVLIGYGGQEYNISYPEAQGGAIKQVQSAPIIQNGYGCEAIVGDAPRLNW